MRRFLTQNLLIFLILLVSWALFYPAMFKTHDYVHAARIAEMGRALADHHLPVRWSENFGFGYGMPLFSFYAPLPYFVGALFWLSGLPVVVVIKLLYLLSTAILGWGIWKLLSKRWGLMAGLAGATLAMTAPYRAVDIFVRGALSELWGLMAIPWILYEMDQIFRGRKDSWWKFGGWIAVLLLSHNLTAVTSFPLVSVWFVINLFEYWGKKQATKKIKSSFISTLKGGLFGLALASFYIWPALFEKSFTQLDKLILGGYFDFNLHFLYFRQFLRVNWGYGGSAWGLNDGISFFLGFGQLLVILISSALLTKKVLLIESAEGGSFIKKFLKRKNLIGLVLLILLFLVLSLATFKTQKLWWALPQLAYVQFPWRFLGVAAIVIAILGGWLVSNVSKLKLIPFSLLLILLSLSNVIFFRPSDFADYTQQFYYTDPSRIQQSMSGILPDYLPTKFKPERVGVFQDMIYQPKSLRADSQLIVDQVHEKLLKLHLSQPTTVTLSLAYFPGWEVEIDGTKTTTAVNDNGLIEVKVPKGDHNLGLIWTETPVRYWSDLISLLAFLILFIKLPVWRKQ